MRFHGDLTYFLKNEYTGGEIGRTLCEPTSVKDIIEACGVPHPEVDRILVNGKPVDFKHVLRNNSVIDVYPVGFIDIDVEASDRLQRRDHDRFVVDGHLGKLARNLRLLGFDVVYSPPLDDVELLQTMEKDERAILTRDRRLLMHSIVRDGYCPRSDDPLEQTIEVVRRFGLISRTKPFTRCLQCNSFLREIDKSAVLEQLEPLTRIYYEEFRSCTGCGKIFWRGSHFSKLESLLERVRSELEASGPG
ncbi:MAG TPA: Mut7-C RNAse domain-containing protein [Chthoniobacterales bacterium]|nr:Mut7-C RNAse domain-containing protein [Chthoniobacterales bacterium]